METFYLFIANMKLLKKSEVVASKVSLSIRCTNLDYLEDYPVINKMDNPEVIILYIKQAFKEGVVIRYKDLPEKPIEVLGSSNKR